MWKRIRFWALAAVVAAGTTAAFAAGPRVLFFHKSAGYEHSVVKVENAAPNHVETVIRPLVAKMGGSLDSTKDGAVISKDTLKNYDVVVFYTTGDLCRPDCEDGSPPVDENGMTALLDWIKGGGGFVGYHCASDTWHRNDNQFKPESPYLDVLGGEFRSHGAQFEGTLKVVDPDHPAMANVRDGWQVNDEWYLFSGLQDASMHVLALLEPGSEREKQEKYRVPAYPVIWCSAPGEGRVLYNAMGHREDVWTNPDFQTLFIDSITWAGGAGETDAAPNWREVVPSELDPEHGAARVEGAGGAVVEE